MGMNRKSNGRVSEDRKQFLLSVGYNPDDVIVWRLKWQRIKYHSLRCGKECKLSFEQYIHLAVEAGIRLPSDIGNTKDKYVMARYGDKGGYVYGNCRFIRQSDNYKEYVENGGKQKMIDALTGRSKSTCIGILSASTKKSKNYRVISPSGVVFSGRNLTDFCKKHQLNRGNTLILFPWVCCLVQVFVLKQLPRSRRP